VVAVEGRLTDWISIGVLASSVPRDARHDRPPTIRLANTGLTTTAA
jgi:hypothetical protein